MSNPGTPDLTTVNGIVSYVKPLVAQYVQFPSKKSEVVDKLRLVFDINSLVWPRVIQLNKLTATFHDKLGKKGRFALRKLLLELDRNHYKDVDFDID